MLSRFWPFATPWCVAHQAPLSMGFSRPEYWSGVPFPAPGTLPHPGTDPLVPAYPELAGGFFTTSTTWGAGRSAANSAIESAQGVDLRFWPWWWVGVHGSKSIEWMMEMGALWGVCGRSWGLDARDCRDGHSFPVSSSDPRSAEG